MNKDNHEEALLWITSVYVKSANFDYSDMQTFLDALDDMENQLK